MFFYLHCIFSISNCVFFSIFFKKNVLKNKKNFKNFLEYFIGIIGELW
jgi:hypothetical protein